MNRVAVVCLALVLAGCLDGPPPSDDVTIQFKPCADPWPCVDGSHWPPDLVGPFGTLPTQSIAIPLTDGETLRGLLIRPDIEPASGLPVVLVMTPYMDFHAAPDSNEIHNEYDLPQTALLAAGYAVAFVAQRGTWYSSGCFEYFTDRSHLDAVEVVQWLAEADWSNGRVGMMGVSLPTMSAWGAALRHAPGLKAVALGGNNMDPLLWGMTPQGLAFADMYAAIEAVEFGGGFSTGIWFQESHVSPRTTEGVVHPCPNAFTDLSSDWLNPDRTAIAELMLVPDLYEANVAIMTLQGSRDGLLWSDEDFWANFDAPQAQLIGDWGHELPGPDHFPEWPAPLLEWFDFWLKGLDVPASLGHTTFITDRGARHTVEGWPPLPPSHALYIGSGLHAQPQQVRDVLATPASNVEDGFTGSSVSPAAAPYQLPCQAEEASALRYDSEPIVEPVVLAGEGIAWMHVEATSGTGGAMIHVWRAEEDASCDQGVPVGYTLVTSGGFDLDYYDGRVVPARHAQGSEHLIRVDLNSMHHEFAPGERLVLTISPGTPGDWWAGARAAGQVITFLGDGTATGSHIVLPFYEGTMPAGAPLNDYGQRPFSRAWFEASD